MPAKAGIQGLQAGAFGYSSWIPALRLGSPVPAALAQAGQASAGIQKFQAEAACEPPWIPAFAGMTPPRPPLRINMTN